MARIGVFFCTDEILFEAYEVKEGKQQGAIFNAPEGHDRVWRNKFAEKHGRSYDFWPRGRVSYNTNSKQFIIYHDKCISSEHLEAVRALFEVPKEAVRYTVDEYYSCQACQKKMMDDEESIYISF